MLSAAAAADLPRKEPPPPAAPVGKAPIGKYPGTKRTSGRTCYSAAIVVKADIEQAALRLGLGLDQFRYENFTKVSA